MGLIKSQDILGFLDGSITMTTRIHSPDGDTTNGTPPKENPKLDTAAKVWKALADSYASSTQEHEFALEQKLHRHHHDRFSSMNEYIRVFKKICEEFAAIGKPLQDKDKVFTLLTGLGKDYEAFMTTMLKPPCPTFYEFRLHLKSHEIIRSMNTDLVISKSNNQVFLAQRHGRGGFRGRGSSRGGRYNSSFTSKGQDFLILICSKPRHTKVGCYQRFNHSYQSSELPQQFAALSLVEKQDYAWYPYTGATSHMTSDPGELDTASPYHGPEKSRFSSSRYFWIASKFFVTSSFSAATWPVATRSSLPQNAMQPQTNALPQASFLPLQTATLPQNTALQQSDVLPHPQITALLPQPQINASLPQSQINASLS
ncbi:hypothetical protein COLO4_33905 [Corchorus olitorius]|uniref:Uncharacterized protein n=1 Tax=Corchorus olitorius TaxID=93759 RepID=A0A1R3GQ62_9ROSI|nr:hypothetical protein COLO4_33905 [Corchorus olitorius]